MTIKLSWTIFMFAIDIFGLFQLFNGHKSNVNLLNKIKKYNLFELPFKNETITRYVVAFKKIPSRIKIFCLYF